jgi:hypothetical protein
MKTLKLRISDALDAKLAAAARRQKTTKSIVVRRTLEAALAPRPGVPRPSMLDLVRDLVGCVEGSGDLSVNKAHLRGFGRE